MKIDTLLNHIFTKHWSDLALISDERSFSYGDLYSHAVAIRDWLIAHGCSAGDTVALRLSNGWPFAASYLGCLVGGFRIVPVNLEFNIDDQRYILDRVSPQFIIEDETKLVALAPVEVNSPNFDSAIGETVIVFFTSGTTGRPKGVCHSLNKLIANVMLFNRSQELDSNTRLYHVLPMAYMAGFLNTLLSPWLAGGVVLLGPRFRPAEALQFWNRPLAWKANTLWLTPTLAATLVRMSRDAAIAQQVSESFNRIFCGTAPLPLTIREAFRTTFNCCLQESYGMSEVLLVSAQTQAEAALHNNVGQLLPGVKATFRPNPEYEVDELVINTPFALISYLLEDGESSPLLADGGMPTGDTGQLENDMLVISGRLKDLIIRGGLNISPVAVENVLLGEVGVVEAAVIGLPHDFWGESIVACIVTAANISTESLLPKLQLRCAHELGEGMRPDRYVWLDNLPRAATGKVQKHKIAERLL